MQHILIVCMGLVLTYAPVTQALQIRAEGGAVGCIGPQCSFFIGGDGQISSGSPNVVSAQASGSAEFSGLDGQSQPATMALAYDIQAEAAATGGGEDAAQWDR